MAFKSREPGEIIQKAEATFENPYLQSVVKEKMQ